MRTYDIVKTGKRIRDLRTKAGYTQADLASMVGVREKYFNCAETGKRGCSVDVLVILADIFHVSLDYLICGGITEKDVIREELRKAKEYLEAVEAKL